MSALLSMIDYENRICRCLAALLTAKPNKHDNKTKAARHLGKFIATLSRLYKAISNAISYVTYACKRQ